MNVDDILNARHATHGYFADVASVAVALRQILRDRKPDLMPDQEEALTMICTKMARIVCGDPNEIDHWKDLVGYPQLIVDRLEGKSR